MEGLTHEYSQYPSQIMERHYFKDVDDSIASLVSQIKTLQAQGQYDKVSTIIKNNNVNLSQYCLSADYINAIDEEIRNLQIYAKNGNQRVYVGNEPDALDLNDIWIGD